MRSNCAFFVGVALVAVLAAGPAAAAEVGSATDLTTRVREAALTTWVHGITPEIAEREVGAAGAPILLDLLLDPDFPRRDNVVAFLGQLGWDLATPRLIELLDDPAIPDDRPEDRRSRLLVPDALGRIAARGGVLAQSALVALETAPTEEFEPSMREMIEHGRRLASDSSSDPVARETGEAIGTSAIDASTFSERLLLTYSNHVNVNDPISNNEVDALLQSASMTFGTETDTTDTACCIQLMRTGSGGSFGTPGDGLDVITTAGELSDAIGDDSARIKVVDVIGYCGGPGANIIGCGNSPGNGIVVVRLSSAFDEGLLWGHEFGHNTGLGHAATGGFVMSPSLSSNNTRLSEADCTSYHDPSILTQITPFSVGVCHDLDGDEIVSSTDNCPTTSNANQTNTDGDTVGNACDNCPTVSNSSQVDCDADSVGDACDIDIDVPDEPVTNVRFKLVDLLRWDPEPYTKRIRRGSLAVGAPWPFNESEIATVVGDTLQETVVPTPNSIFYYLVTTFNSCGESP